MPDVYESDESPFIRVSKNGIPSNRPEPRVGRSARSVTISDEEDVSGPVLVDEPERVMRTRSRMTMPKRLSEEARELADEEAEREAAREASLEAEREAVAQPVAREAATTKARRKPSTRRKAAPVEEQIPLPLKQPRPKPDALVRQRQVLGFSCIVLAILVLIALVTYTVQDASVAETKISDLPVLFFHPDAPTPAQELVQANADRVHNGLGLIGAMLADFLINGTIGYAALIYPIFFGWWSLAFFKFTYKQRKRLTLATTFFLITAVLFSASLGTASGFFNIPREWSGAVGQFLGLAFTRLIGSAGAFIIYFSAFIITLVFSIDLDIEKTYHRLHGYWTELVLWTRRQLIAFWDRREARLDERDRRREQEDFEAAQEAASGQEAAFAVAAGQSIGAVADDEADDDGNIGVVSILTARKRSKSNGKAAVVGESGKRNDVPAIEEVPLSVADVQEQVHPSLDASGNEMVATDEEHDDATAVPEGVRLNPTAAALGTVSAAVGPQRMTVQPGQPLLKVRPAPKRAAGIPRMTRPSERLGERSINFTRLSNGAAEPQMETPLAQASSQSVEQTATSERLGDEPAANLEALSTVPMIQAGDGALDEVSNIDLSEEIVQPLSRARKHAGANAVEVAEPARPEVELGDEKSQGDEILPHSEMEDVGDLPGSTRQSRDGIARMATASRDNVDASGADSEESYEEGAKPVIPENPYNELLIRFKNPPLNILTASDPKDELDANDEELKMKGRLLRDKLATFGVNIENITVTPGPVVTLYEFTPAEGVKVSRVENLTDDIALAMKARGIRIIAPIPGRGTIGVEIPNDVAKMVRIRSLFESASFRNTKMNLPLALGKTISGDVYVDDLNKMPHLLIAGATGSGKSVGVNGIIASLLYAKSPRDVKFVIIDPKKIELSLYKKLRKHYLILSPEAGEDIVTTPQFAVLALKAVEQEMERRYDKLAKAGVRSLADYNIKVGQGKLRSTQDEQHYHLPYIVVIIDELADLMITAAREIEEPICRIAQMARAVGIHLILATQRPSVDVITGVIKANFPARMAYQVATRVDSRTILDSMGAEQLLGNGDMLYQPSGTPKPIRLQSPFISTDEVEAMIEAIAVQTGPQLCYSRPWTLPALKTKDGKSGSVADTEDSRDELFAEAARVIVRHQQGSVSLLQRRLKVGYSRAARIVDELEQAGIVGAFDGSKARQVLCESLEELELVLEGLP